MTLTTRLLVFHLASLTAVLAGFSATLAVLAWDHLQRQADERVEAALNTLCAAAEVAPDGVEWEPHDHTFRVPPGTAPDGLVWVVTDGAGRVVAHSDSPPR